MIYQSEREQVLEAALRLHQAGVIPMSSGNISTRCAGGHVAITPSGTYYDRMTPADVVIVDLADGGVIEATPGLKPSSEWPMHRFLLGQMPEVTAVIHTHAPYAIAFSAVGRPIPAVSFEAVSLGGIIPVTRYAPAGTVAIGEAALEALIGPPAVKSVLLRNHGSLSIGKTLDAAYQAAYNTELAARIYHIALQLGTPTELSRDQMDEILAVYAAKKA